MAGCRTSKPKAHFASGHLELGGTFRASSDCTCPESRPGASESLDNRARKARAGSSGLVVLPARPHQLHCPKNPNIASRCNLPTFAVAYQSMDSQYLENDCRTQSLFVWPDPVQPTKASHASRCRQAFAAAQSRAILLRLFV